MKGEREGESSIMEDERKEEEESSIMKDERREKEGERRTGDAKVPERDGTAKFLHPRQEKAANAGVNMKREIVGLGDDSNLFNGIDGAMRVLRSTSNKENGISSDRCGVLFHVHSFCLWIDVDVNDFESKVK